MGVVGSRIKRIDGKAKVMATATYTEDIRLPNALYVLPVFAGIPHAKVTNIDTSAMCSLPGVHEVLTWRDVPGELCFGAIRQDQPLLVKDRIRCVGDPIVVVVSEHKYTEKELRERISLTYEDLPPLFDPEEALKPDAIQIHASYPNNISATHKVIKGNAVAELKRCKHVIERSYGTQLVEHAYLELESVFARSDNNGGVVLVGSFQNPFTARKSIARVLGLTLAQVRIIQPEIGGSFGGKDDVMHYLGGWCALAALKTGRPARCQLTREQSLLHSYKRHPYKMFYRAGFNDEGRVHAMEIKIIADSGAYTSKTPTATWRSAVHAAGPYDIEHVHISLTAAYTNNPYTGSMRGFGSPQITFAYESLMDEIAVELGKDPFRIRKINALKNGGKTATGQYLKGHQVSLNEVLDKAAKASEYFKKEKEYRRDNSNNFNHIKKGIGIGVSYRGVSLGAEGVDAAGCIVEVQSDGSVTVTTGLSEMGQGLKTIVVQIVADELGIGVERIKYIPLDTSLAPDSGPTVASRGTLVAGNAALAAATKLKRIIGEVVHQYIDGTTSGELIFVNNCIYRKGSSPDKGVSFDTAIKLAYAKGLPLLASGWFSAPPITWDDELGQGAPFFSYTYGCQIAEVEVDELTGKVNVKKVTACHDVGRAINPDGTVGQIIGGVTMGVGYALLEDIGLVEGKIANKNLDRYLIPTSLDVPTVEVLLVENFDPDGPMGAKGIGEPATEVTAAAIANAVYAATGRRMRCLPLDLETVFLSGGKR